MTTPMPASPDEDISDRTIRPEEELLLAQRQTWSMVEQAGNPGLYQPVRPTLSVPTSTLEGSQWNASAMPGESDMERPPPGCAPDAIKLFVGSIPKSYTESQLLPFFETIGKVVDLVIVRDKMTRESKGSAFLWYATRAHAEMAILQFNLRHVLPNPSGEHNRPLVLRRAKLRTQAQARQSPASSSNMAAQVPASRMSHSTSGQFPGQGTLGAGPRSQSVYRAAPPHAIMMPDMMGHSQLLPRGSHGQHMALHSYQGPGGHMGELQHPQRSYGTPFRAAPYPSNSGSDVHGGAPPSLNDMDAMAQALRSMQLSGNPGTAAPNSADSHLATQGQPGSSLRSVSMDITSQQLGVVNDYMHSVQNISGAKLTISVGNAPGIFRLTVTGVESQVETAKTLLSSVVQP